VDTLLARAGLDRRAGFLIPSRGQTIVGWMNGGDLMRRLLCALALALGSTSGEAADLLGPIAIREPIQAVNPCADANVLRRIAQRFARAERETWHRGFVMASLANGRDSGHPFFEPGLIKRDYCVADSVMTNGSAHSVYYAIEYGVGFASIGNYVDFCVLGLDPWHVHDEACRTVR
jgi:hypothetical protein